MPKPSRADIAKLFQNPSPSSSQSSFYTSSPSTLPSNLPPHHQPLSSLSQQPQQPLQPGTHSYSQFVPNSMCPSQQPSGTPHSPAFSRAMPNIQGQGVGPGGPGGPTIPASPQMALHPHHAPPGGIALQVPMQPMFIWVHINCNLVWGIILCPPNICTNSLTCNMSLLPINLDLFPYHLVPQPSNYLAHPPWHMLSHTPLIHLNHLPSLLPTPSTANTPRLNMNTCDFVHGRCSTSKVTIKSQDGTEVTLNTLRKHGPQPPTVPIPPTLPIVTNQLQCGRKRADTTSRGRREGAPMPGGGRLLQEVGQVCITLEEEEQKWQDVLEADEAYDIIQTPSPISEFQEPEDGKVSFMRLSRVG
ncbi:uncharacterized protein EDB91DRAFT_1246986 [Suillus paluster]|uniref:uncharacterized protein n=1 Tax=Suillus paluster TaxID=48578 RepID=UPI001B8796A3|nr:uncharacterized protein EDB91DRAFT_1246986 [Suillus paluster]KAG1744108.1 hypothetical protein EDB91DRAFT_1246986 [Suillus paluster]